MGYPDCANTGNVYTAWAEALLRDGDFPAGDIAIARQHLQSHDENMNVVGEGRWCAWRFLKQVAEDMPAISDDLLEAATCYEAEYMLMCQGWNLMGGLGHYSQDQGVKFADPTIRRQISSLILQARSKDEEAVSHIERALERWTTPLPKTLTYGDDTPMVLIPAGEFQMGDAFSEGGIDERPIHTVYMDAFYIAAYEVTNAQYRRFVQATGHRAPEGWSYVNGEWRLGFKPWLDTNFNGDDQPVLCVSWEDAKAYCEWAGKRLPTEAEWEKAARGGLVGKKFPWGDEDPDGTQCNFADRNAGDGYQYASPVGGFAPNGYGLYDMAGNVWEWCSDWYDPSYYSDSFKENPTGPSSGTSRVLRGGSWNLNPYYMRVSFRFPGVPKYSHNFVGFRCAQDAKP
ncbi:formylglycine-generating enzyme family protein [Candidatus Poribacteria bacterium]